MKIRKGEHFIDHLLLDADEPGWYALDDKSYGSDREAAKVIGSLLDEEPNRVFRIRDYLGGVVWQSPPNKETNDE